MWSKNELNCFHDCVYNATSKSLSDKDLMNLIETIPDQIMSIGLEWGLGDTVFRDNVFDWLRSKSE